jgi:hypothetical protein
MTSTDRPGHSATPSGRLLSREFPARADQVRLVRKFLADALEGCPAADDVLLCVSELASNSVLYSDSRKPGGTFVVRAEICRGSRVRVEVRDDGGRWDELAHTDGRPHGLAIVGTVAAESGIDGSASAGWTAWALIDWSAAGTPGGDGATAPRLAPERALAAVADTEGSAGATAGRITQVSDVPALDTSNFPLDIESELAMSEPRSQGAPAFWASRLLNRGQFQRTQALEDAIEYRSARVAAPCPDCAAAGPEKCDDHARDLDLIAEYRQAIRRAKLILEPLPAKGARRAS